LIESQGFTFIRRSRLGSLENRNPAEVILLDSIGELASLYPLATVVFVGGTLVPRGGHNIIEPAAVARPVIIGPYPGNFKQVVADFLKAEAVIQIQNDEEDPASRLATEVSRLLGDKHRAEDLGRRALALLNDNRGATECTIRAIKQVLGE
jgi:3-deoxy-D-manno-octulosonic-acid transferase